MNSVKTIILLLFLGLAPLSDAQTPTPTRILAEGLMSRSLPRLNFSPDALTADSFPRWQAQMRESMARLMNHPAAEAAKPTRVDSRRCDGYRIERWLSFPLNDAVVPFLVMIPEDVSADNPAPAVMCIPGSGQTMAQMIAEGGMAHRYMREGLIAVAVENPSAGELSDNGRFDYVNSSRFLLEAGWSYLGLASWQDKVILDWMKSSPEIRPDRIIISGFSHGTEPMMALGLIDDSIYAFVYNDFLCRTRERALTMNRPDSNGNRDYPNNIRHLIPNFLMEFDFPDIVSALAPRPIICTEGGMDRDFNIVKSAYRLAGAEDNFVFHHQPKYAAPENRVPLDSMPAGINRDEFFRYANVDPSNHYFKAEHVMPWLKKIL
ncbi:MAG: alpha/beta hydrolase family protein [Bacteroides sp.]|nr:alpha/beta hydrolase family protein [Bacteroides sp.]MCM1379473.1 alpha/beta hydrolase family protein [Bacteroides sp.]MCM1445924.1 alpha/beta hydrolase family protein [Prevotella sp.]